MSDRFRILIADPIAPEGVEPLTRSGRFELIEHSGLKGDALAEALSAVDGVIVRSGTRITRDSLARAARLRVIGRAGVGVDNIDVNAATERGIAVLNAPSGNTISAAELAFALLLAIVRRVPAADASMRRGEWDRKSFNGTELYGKTLGLIGSGRIGSEVGKRARAFGMSVLAYDPFLTEERAAALEIELCTLDDLLARADVISLHVPLTEATAGMIGERQLAAMKRGSYLVNAARGGVVDEAALQRALESGHLAGAALDVFAIEPLPADHPLRTAPNVVLTPHVGAATAEAQANVAIEISEAVRAALLESDFSRAVNAPALGGEEMRRIRPLLELAERLGLVAATLPDAPIQRVEVRYAGVVDDAIRPVASAAVMGLLRNVVGRAGVNLVNAIHLAEARGMQVERVRVGPDAVHPELIEIRLRSASGESMVAGSLVSEHHPRLVRLNTFSIDVAPRGTLLIICNRDVPGVIGRVGSLLGDASVNIAEYHQARLEAGGEALATVTVDGTIEAPLMQKLQQLPDVFDVRLVELG